MLISIERLQDESILDDKKVLRRCARVDIIVGAGNTQAKVYKLTVPYERFADVTDSHALERYIIGSVGQAFTDKLAEISGQVERSHGDYFGIQRVPVLEPAKDAAAGNVVEGKFGGEPHA